MTADLRESTIKAGDHVVQLYESDSDLLSTVGRYLSAAARSGETLVVIATPAHLQAFEREIAPKAVDGEVVRFDGQYILLDATETMSKFIVDGRIDRDAFDMTIRHVLRSALEWEQPLHVYGEMVTLLWEAGEVLLAIELERLWNELGEKLPFSLVCAYPAVNLDPGQLEAMQEICKLHSSVRHPSDGVIQVGNSIARFECSARFAAKLDSPRAARHFMADALRDLCFDEDLMEDAALVVTELAANAVVHACSSFSVTLVADRSVVRIAVRDDVPMTSTAFQEEQITRPGHGLAMIAALSSSWGIEGLIGGKVVWAQIEVVDGKRREYAEFPSID